MIETNDDLLDALSCLPGDTPALDALRAVMVQMMHEWRDRMVLALSEAEKPRIRVVKHDADDQA